MDNKTTLTSQLESMRVGEVIEYPAEQSMSVRALASSLGFKLDRIYKTRTDREKRIITVTRTA
ncbi:MAG: hypothetical protein IJB63_00360 [Alistipes sp.]|nr:hypothetical protein [Alistipes sp.]